MAAIPQPSLLKICPEFVEFLVWEPESNEE
jgi:hypothetical protein